MGKISFEVPEYGISIPVSLTPYIGAEMIKGRLDPLYSFEMSGKKVEIFKTGRFYEKLHLLLGGRKVTHPLEAIMILNYIPEEALEAIRPRTASYKSDIHGLLKIDLSERNKPKKFEMDVYRGDNFVIRQHLGSGKLIIYDYHKNLRSLTDVKKVTEILEEVENKENFTPLTKLFF